MAPATAAAASAAASPALPPPAGEPAKPAPPAKEPPPTEAPPKEPSPTPAAAEPAARPKAPVATPQRPATVELTIRSTPPGARVTRLDTGERLGRTPVRVNVPRKAANAWIQVALDGYQPVKFAVDLRRDNAANLTFQGAKRPLPRRR
ncbi:MAG TPA: PEGA domain-containing protein [Anaeromyxobacteraceae bacterium]|nr:PEGA domain-containing protein [Anaeromyxobacteraceae bacterium]